MGARSAQGWVGSVPFIDVDPSDGHTLAGHIDYVVMTDNYFNTNFGGLGYTPGGDLVYAYQVFNTGDAFMSAEIIGISNPANTIGAFNTNDGRRDSIIRKAHKSRQTGTG